jgi:hypothetical protein
MTSELANSIERACNELGLRADIGFDVPLNSGNTIRAKVRVRDLGAPQGMLIVSEFKIIKPFRDELTSAGFGYSTIDEPRRPEDFTVESWKHIFRDWGWSGPASLRPEWF